MSHSAVVEFELDSSSIDRVPFDRAVYSDVVSAGGHDWRMACFPYDVDNFVSLYLELMSEAKNVTTIFEAAITDSDQVAEPSRFSRQRTVSVYNNPLEPGEYVLSGYARFVHQGDLQDYAGNNGRVTIMCAVSVVGDGTKPMPIDQAPPFPTTKEIAAPPSDTEDRLGRLLDSAALTDVTFVVGDDHQAPPLRAHRALLASRSPVFKAEFSGHKVEANTPSSHIRVRGMDSETFKRMLRFMYTDNLPAGLGDDHDRVLLSLLAAADRYALDSLKLLCARKLLDSMSVDTVAAVLDCAETYNCLELKAKCIDLVVANENFSKIVELVRRNPSIFAETRNK